MKNFLLILFFISTTYSIAQKETYTDNSASFYIHIKLFTSEKAADSLNKGLVKLFKNLDEDIKNSGDEPTETGSLPSVPYLNTDNIKYFRVNPKEYIQFEIRDMCNSKFDKLNFTNIQRTTRDSLITSVFSIGKFETFASTYKEEYKDFSNFKIIKVEKNIVKKICEFKCYKVTLESEKKILEMYVTENIMLNYHPIINDDDILIKYYPLYIKISDKMFPKDFYSEFTFFLDN